MPEFEQVGGPLCLDFANTIHCYTCEQIRDDLKDFSALVEWNRQWGSISEREAETLTRQAARRGSEAEATLQRAKRLRAAIYQIFDALTEGRSPLATEVAVLNEVLAEGLGKLRVAQAEGHRFTWTWAKNQENFDRLLWPIARSAAELLTSDQLPRVHQCNGERCTWLFLDMSKNQSRRWCKMADCGNRAKARRFYERTRSSDG